MQQKKHRLLLLAGTREARLLALALQEREGVELYSAFAGTCSQPHKLSKWQRNHPFGNVQALQASLIENRIKSLVIATHPFAARIAWQAQAAASAQGIPFVFLRRPPWVPESGENWFSFPDIATAVAALPYGARVFSAVGRKGCAVLAARSDLWCLTRLLTYPPAGMPLPRGLLHIAPPSPDPSEEKAVFQQYALTHLLTKNSGGTGAFAKIVAARRIGVPVFAVARPALPSEPCVTSVKEALTFLEDFF